MPDWIKEFLADQERREITAFRADMARRCYGRPLIDGDATTAQMLNRAMKCIGEDMPLFHRRIWGV